MVRLLSMGIEVFSSVIFVIPTVLILQYMVFKQRSFSKLAAVTIFMLYLAALFSVVGIPTVCSWHIHPEFNWIPLIDIVNSPPDYIRNTILNILLFVPLGFIVPTVWREYRSLKAAVWMGSSLSLFIELLQIFTFRLTDIDDLITNTAGCVLGFYMAKRFSFRLLFGLSGKNAGSSSKYEPVIILTAAFLIGFSLKSFVSNAMWDKVLSSQIWESIK